MRDAALSDRPDDRRGADGREVPVDTPMLRMQVEPLGELVRPLEDREAGLRMSAMPRKAEGSREALRSRLDELAGVTEPTRLAIVASLLLEAGCAVAGVLAFLAFVDGRYLAAGGLAVVAAVACELAYRIDAT